MKNTATRKPRFPRLLLSTYLRNEPFAVVQAFHARCVRENLADGKQMAEAEIARRDALPRHDTSFRAA